MKNWEGKGRIYCCDVARLTSILLCSSDLKQVFEEWRDRRKGRDCRYLKIIFPYNDMCKNLSFREEAKHRRQ